MIAVKPGQKIPLSYVFPQGTAGNVVKAVIEKFDGTVLTTLTLTETSPGDQMDQSFSMPTAVSFVKAKLVPYLADGVTPDISNPITQEVYGAITPIITSRIKVLVGCEDQPTQAPVVISQASDQNLLLSFNGEDGAPIDITQATDLEIGFLEADNTTVLSKTLGSGITLVFDTINQALVQMVAADFALLPTGDNDARVKIALGGSNFAINVYSAIAVEPDVV